MGGRRGWPSTWHRRPSAPLRKCRLGLGASPHIQSRPSALTTTMLSLSIFTSSFSFGPGPVNSTRVSDIYMYDAANPLKVRVIV